MTGPVPAVKFSSAPPRGQGVTPDTVLPYPGTSVHVMPLTDVLRDACAASMEMPPSPSTKPLNPPGTTVWFATSIAGTTDAGCPAAVAVNVIAAFWTPETLLQSTEKYTRVSGLLGLTEPEVGEIFTQEALLVTVNLKGEGPPAPTSMKRLPKGTKGSSVIVGLPQL